MKKVIVFGTFDIIHPGHLNLFRQAKRHGDHLMVVVARDDNVKRFKGIAPLHDEMKRVEKLKILRIANEIVLGDKRDKYKIIAEHKPDVVCIGYDQYYNEEELKAAIDENELKTKIVKLDRYKDHRYKSSKLKGQ